jgi:hypothetical protein
MSDTELLRDLIGALDKKLTDRLDVQDRTLRRIEEQVRETNGRVTTIETERTAEKAVRDDGQERRVRREDYRRGPLVQHHLAAVLAAVAALVLNFIH